MSVANFRTGQTDPQAKATQQAFSQAGAGGRPPTEPPTSPDPAGVHGPTISLPPDLQVLDQAQKALLDLSPSHPAPPDPELALGRADGVFWSEGGSSGPQR